MYCYKHIKDDRKKRLSVVRIGTDVDLSADGTCIAKPYGRLDPGFIGGVPITNEEYKHLVYGRAGYELIVSEDVVKIYAGRKQRGEKVQFLFRSPVSAWTVDSCCWVIRHCISPSGHPDAPLSDIQYDIIPEFVGTCSAVLAARLDVWEFVGLLVASVKPEAKELYTWLHGEMAENTHEKAFLYFAEAVLFTLYDGGENADAAEHLAGKLWDVIQLGNEITAALFVEDLLTSERDTLNFCVDDWFYDGEDDRVDSDERWRSAHKALLVA